MAFPVILIDSATGSDSAASGAGPSTALTGTLAATNAGGTVVTLDAGTVLTGVATDGSHAIFVNDSTADHRNFAAITASSGSGGATPTVTVAQALTGLLAGKTWAIGGKRASIGSATSRRLLSGASVSGDAAAGWVIEFQSGHTESCSARIEMRGMSGSSPDGFVKIRGAVGAVVMPVITFTNTGGVNEQGFLAFGSGYFEGFDLRNSAANPGAALYATASVFARRMRIAESTNKFSQCIFSGSSVYVDGGELAYAQDSSTGALASATRGCNVQSCYIHDNLGYGYHLSADLHHPTLVLGNIFKGNGLSGIFLQVNDEFSPDWRVLNVSQNDCHGNGGDGIRINGIVPFSAVENNILTNNGGYGVRFNSGAATVAQLVGWAVQMRSNAFYNNTSGKYLPAGLDTGGVSINEVVLTGDPFTNASAGDFTLNSTSGAGAACKDVAYPNAIP